MGKEVIAVADGPGFLVNRCGRPFSGEGLRLLQERVATHEQIDRICRLGGGFRMGPFELMDLVGIDVGFEVAQSFDELSFGEPRWRPNPIQARMVAAGRLGRKSGRGYYEYADDGSYRPDDPEPPAAGGGRRDRGGAPRRRPARRRAARARPRRRRTSCARAVRPSWSWTPGPPGAGPRGQPAAPSSRRSARDRPVRRHEPRRARRARSGRLPPAAAARRHEARGADAAPDHPVVRLRGRRALLREPRLPDRVGRATRPGSCSAGSSASS